MRYIVYRDPFDVWVEALYTGNPNEYYMGEVVLPKAGDALVHHPSPSINIALGSIGLRVESACKGDQKRAYVGPVHVLVNR